MTVERLRTELQQLLGFTAHNLLRLAVVVAELEKRGEDLKGLKIGLLPILRLIAAGKLLPGIVVLYAGQPKTILHIAGMSIEEQEKLATIGAVVELPKPKQKKPSDDHPWRTGAERRVSSEGPIHVPRDYLPPDQPSGYQGPSIAKIASRGNPKDVAEMAANLIIGAEQSDAVLRELLRILKTAALSPAAKKAVRAADLAFEEGPGN